MTQKNRKVDPIQTTPLKLYIDTNPIENEDLDDDDDEDISSNEDLSGDEIK